MAITHLFPRLSIFQETPLCFATFAPLLAVPSILLAAFKHLLLTVLGRVMRTHANPMCTDPRCAPPPVILPDPQLVGRAQKSCVRSRRVLPRLVEALQGVDDHRPAGLLILRCADTVGHGLRRSAMGRSQEMRGASFSSWKVLGCVSLLGSRGDPKACSDHFASCVRFFVR